MRDLRWSLSYRTWLRQLSLIFLRLRPRKRLRRQRRCQKPPLIQQLMCVTQANYPTHMRTFCSLQISFRLAPPHNIDWTAAYGWIHYITYESHCHLKTSSPTLDQAQSPSEAFSSGLSWNIVKADARTTIQQLSNPAFVIPKQHKTSNRRLFIPW